ncbi:MULTISPECIES: serine hydrolase [unclassified Nocardiopsis]|uniref:serine hydrolase n=1 Tax=unclassified Nocardiopsis TaxID=2649073 RepID=UPI0013568B84|nr:MULTISPECIES: serine hydrolase [unclassified Nocardiopsis]
MSTTALLRALREELEEAGLRGAFLVRDLDTGRELGIEPDLAYPTASLVKVPLAVATLERIRAGELDGAERLLVPPGAEVSPGPTGLSMFRHPAAVSLEDLLYLSLCLSDNAATDTLFGLTPPARVAASLRAAGLHGITVRHLMRDINETPADRLAPEEVHLAHSLAIGAGTAGRGHPVRQLDVTRANSGSARAFADLLRELWRPTRIHSDVAARVRELMGANQARHRLAPDFTSDLSRWSSKTGTMLNLRHEVGVVEHDDGQAFAVAVLTESRVAAQHQPGAEAVMARVARALRDHLRSG